MKVDKHWRLIVYVTGVLVSETKYNYFMKSFIVAQFSWIFVGTLNRRVKYQNKMLHDISELWKQMYMYLDTELVTFYKHINSYALTPMQNLLQVYIIAIHVPTIYLTPFKSMHKQILMVFLGIFLRACYLQEPRP